MYFYCDSVLFLLILIQRVVGREVPDLTLFIRNTSNKIEPTCIVDRNILDSPIAWSYPIAELKESLPIIVSKYIPYLENTYSCNFFKTKQCTSLWQMEDWQFSKFDSHKFKPVLDIRWEDFPTLLTSSSVKEFKNRIDIPHTFELGISIRAERNAEIFLCTGWDPYAYPCYYISIGGDSNEQAFLRKYKKIPHTIGKNDTKLDKYMRDDNILSPDEWRNFIVSLTENGTISLMETFQNISLLNYEDTKALQPIYLFIRSKESRTLWKIHNNHYIFTNQSKLSQLGPTFSNFGDNLCVSLFVSMCRYCRMTFYIMIKGEKQIIKTVFNENDHDDLLWKEIKLLQHDLAENKIKLFVETKYVNNTVVSDGFWGIDDVRICSEDEIRVTRLVSNLEWHEKDLPHISCQALAVPTWRPIQNTFVSNKNEIEFIPTSTTIAISRKSQSNDEHHAQQPYVIQYEGKDVCNKPEELIKSKSRLKSRGLLVARSTNIEIKDLVPYTTYNIIVWNVIDEIQIQRDVSTFPTDIPKTLELPKNVAIQARDSSCDILWDIPNCNETFGPIIYQVEVSNNNGSISTQTDIKTHYTFKDLQPSSQYDVKICTARKLENLKTSNLSVALVYNFTTHTNVPSVVKNLEVYATTRNSAHLRFELSDDLQAEANSTQLRWCHPLSSDKCNNNTIQLTKCTLWNQKFCINVHNLSNGFNYTFFVSLKNEKNHIIGGEENITAAIIERVPGIPSNVTYKMRNCVKTIDCCHLNVSWAHPVNQSGSITMFDIVLTESSYTYVLDSFKSIHEVLKINGKGYQPIYNYNIKYISCTVPYKISVRAVNDYYKGQFASTTIAVNSKTDYVDLMPKYVNSTNETVTFKLPPAEYGLEGSSLIIIVQDYNKNKIRISEDINKIETFDDANELCHSFGETWIAKVIQVNETIFAPIVIGDGTMSYVPQLNQTVVNRRLTPDTEYCFTFTITKRINDSEHVIVYHDRNLITEANYFSPQLQNDERSETATVAAYLLPILVITFLTACGAWLSYRYFRKRRRGGELAYEAMPFEDYFTDAVSKDSYDS